MNIFNMYESAHKTISTLPYEVRRTSDHVTLYKISIRYQEGFLHSQPRKTGGFGSLILKFLSKLRTQLTKILKERKNSKSNFCSF